jgi:hypothetical protein
MSSSWPPLAYSNVLTVTVPKTPQRQGSMGSEFIQSDDRIPAAD